MATAAALIAAAAIVSDVRPDALDVVSKAVTDTVKMVDVVTHLTVNSEPSYDTCPDTVAKACPCDYLIFMQELCLDFAKHMNSKYPGDNVIEISVSARYYHNCLESTFTCELTHSKHEAQTLEYTLHAHPCERVAEIATRYSFSTKLDMLTDPLENPLKVLNFTTRAERLREGEKHIVLSAPDHPDKPAADTTHYTEYLRVYFKDHVRKHPETGEYFRGFHMLFEVENDRAGNNPPPQWRQISYKPEMKHCGKCQGGVGCMGGPTSAIIITSIVASVLCILATCVLSCRRKALVPQV